MGEGGCAVVWIRSVESREFKERVRDEQRENE